MANGDIGTPSVFRSQTCDKLDPSGFFVAYAEFSGGIFVDCSIHDIDLALWFFGEDSKVKSVTAVGITAVQPDLRKHNDRDNAVGIIEFYVSDPTMFSFRNNHHAQLLTLINRVARLPSFTARA